MKKYKFAFGSVQRVQRIAEEQAAVSLAEAQRAADAASAQLQARLADIGAARPAPGPRSTTEFHAQREHLDRHRVAVTAARAAEINALELLGSARADWVDAARKVALRDQPGTAGSDARDLLSFAHGVGAAGEEDAEPVVIEVAEPST